MSRREQRKATLNMSPAECGCITTQECHDPLCRYQEPHRHSFACDNTCGCGGRGYDVIDPENHPKHIEWQMQLDHEKETEQ